MVNIASKTDIVYDEAHDLKVDMYWPVDADAKGAIIDIHGGGWFRGDKSKDADIAERLAHEGYVVATPNYREVPEAYYPAPLEDMDTVLAWLKDSEYTFDRNKIGVFGSSSGGNMSVEMGIKHGLPIVSLSGILDIDDWLSKHGDVVAAQNQKTDLNQLASKDINQDGSNDPFYKWFIVNYFNGRTDQYEEATPFHRVSDQTGPMYLANSLNEFVPNSGIETMGKTLTDHQIPFTLRMVPGTQHAKGYLDAVYDDVINFFNREIK